MCAFTYTPRMSGKDVVPEILEVHLEYTFLFQLQVNPRLSVNRPQLDSTPLALQDHRLCRIHCEEMVFDVGVVMTYDLLDHLDENSYLKF